MKTKPRKTWEELENINHMNSIYDESHPGSARSITFGRGIVKKEKEAHSVKLNNTG